MLPYFLLMAFVLFGPPVWSTNHPISTNTPLGIWLKDEDALLTDHQYPSAVEAQERIEFKIPWMIGLAAAFPVLIFTPSPIDGLISMIVATTMMGISRILTNHFDMVGHLTEINTAIAANYRADTYRDEEIHRMLYRDRERMAIAQKNAKKYNITVEEWVSSELDKAEPLADFFRWTI